MAADFGNYCIKSKCPTGDFLTSFITCSGFLTESKTTHFSPFFTFSQLRSTGYAPSKTQN
jgi:hypothetical protein